MRETNFIKQNKDKWKEFEQTLKSNKKDPDKLSHLFIEITDDLSYSRTFYPNRSVRVYLNNLAQQIFYNIYKNKKSGKGKFRLFWTDELPQLVWEARREMLLSAVLFFLAFLIGAVSCANDPNFIRTILGDAYVNMTIANIESGDPMAVYKQQNEVDMSFGITYNNAMVAFMTFIYGALYAIGTVGIMIYNGVMIGSFHYFMYEQGVLRESLLTVWIHGTLEISAIIIAGMAGLTMGRGLVFPGTYSRMQSFRRSAIRGLKIMVGIMPIIVAAGFIEGFVTRYTEAPEILRLGIILASLSFILIYFVWYPWIKSKEGFATKVKDVKLPPSKPLKINFGRIKTSGEIFTDTFVFYRKHFQYLFKTGFFTAIAYTGLILLILGTSLAQYVNYYQWSFWNIIFGYDLEAIGLHYQNLFQYFDQSEFNAFIILNTVLFAGLSYVINLKWVEEMEGDSYQKRKWWQHTLNVLKGVVIFGMINALYLFTESGWAVFWLSFLSPILLLWYFAMVKERLDIFNGLGKAFSLIGSRWGTIWGVFLSMLIISFMLSFILGSDFLWKYIDIISWNLELDELTSELVLDGILTFVFMLMFSMILPILIGSIAIFYGSLQEIKDATHLQERIKNIGVKHRAFGMEKES